MWLCVCVVEAKPHLPLACPSEARHPPPSPSASADDSGEKKQNGAQRAPKVRITTTPRPRTRRSMPAKRVKAAVVVDAGPSGNIVGRQKVEGRITTKSDRGSRDKKSNNRNEPQQKGSKRAISPVFREAAEECVCHDPTDNDNDNDNRYCTARTTRVQYIQYSTVGRKGSQPCRVGRRAVARTRNLRKVKPPNGMNEFTLNSCSITEPVANSRALFCVGLVQTSRAKNRRRAELRLPLINIGL